MAAAGNDFGGYSSDSYGYGQPAFGAQPPYGFGAPPFGAPMPFPGAEIPSPLDAEIQIVLREIHNEVQVLEQSGEYGEQFKNARRLLTTEATKLENNIDPEWLEVDIQKQIKVSKKVLIPSFRHQKFNFVGKVLGPKGTTLQNIAKTYKCHVYILGRGSTRDRAKEQELLSSGDPQYAHFGGPLHVKVETTAPPATAYSRVAGVLEILSKLLQPIKDTHIDGITTEPLPGAEGGGEGGEGGDDTETGGQNGNDGGAGGSGNGGGPSGSGGGPMRAGGRGGGGFQRGGGGGMRGSGGGGGFQPRGGGFQQRGGGFGGGRGDRGGRGGGMGRGGGRGGGGGHRGYQPY